MEKRRKIHMSTSIDGLLRLSDAKTKVILNCVYDEHGNHPQSVEEFRDMLLDELNKGHKLLPAPGCDNFDPVKGCLGHPY